LEADVAAEFCCSVGDGDELFENLVTDEELWEGLVGCEEFLEDAA
jgi:hypothetical protein